MSGGRLSGVHIRRVGLDALLVEVADVTAAVAVYEEARRRGVRVTDVVPGACTVLFDGVADLAALEESLPGWPVGTAERHSGGGPVVEVPTRYDGPDLDDVARAWEMTRDEVVRTHTTTSFVVAFCGFAPGFPYCTGLPEHLSVARLDAPRARVPAGSVGVAGAFTGIYPSASPGGWRLLGRTDLRLWDEQRDPPATLPPGTRVRFVAA
jgi:KipI family sensor histidine kinase inhibitor